MRPTLIRLGLGVRCMRLGWVWNRCKISFQKAPIGGKGAEANYTRMVESCDYYRQRHTPLTVYVDEMFREYCLIPFSVSSYYCKNGKH